MLQMYGIVFWAFVIMLGGLAIFTKIGKSKAEKSARTVNAKVLKINPPDPNTMYIGGVCNEVIFEIDGGERVKFPVKTDVLIIEGESGALTYSEKYFYSFVRK